MAQRYPKEFRDDVVKVARLRVTLRRSLPTLVPTTRDEITKRCTRVRYLMSWPASWAKSETISPREKAMLARPT